MPEAPAASPPRFPRILVVAQPPALAQRAPTLAASFVAGELARRGFATRVLTVGRQPRQGPAPSELTVRRAAIPSIGIVATVRNALRLAATLIASRRTYDAMHVDGGGTWASVVAVLLGRALGKAVVVHYAGDELAPRLDARAQTLRLAVHARLADYVLCPDAIVRRAAERRGHPPRKLVTLPDGVDLARFHPESDAAKAARREALGWPAGVTLVYCGRLTPDANLTFLVRAFARLVRTRTPDATLVIAGDGADAGEIGRLARTLGIAARLVLLPARDDAAALVCAADIVALPSERPQSAAPLLEAMAAGVPAVVPDTGGPLALLEHGVHGLTLAAHDEPAWVAGLARLAEEPLLRHAMGKRARALVDGRYGLEQCGARLEGLYRTIAPRPRAAWRDVWARRRTLVEAP